jgi:hypothetical protein
MMQNMNKFPENWKEGKTVMLQKHIAIEGKKENQKIRDQ